MNSTINIRLFSLSVLLFSSSVLAQTTVPNVFVSGEPALASEVNANFTELVQGIQDLENSQVSGSCVVGSYVAAIATDGTLTCETGTDSSSNTRFGLNAFVNNPTGSGNTAIGESALSSVTYASNNTAVGYEALATNTGTANTAVGWAALQYNSNGILNTAVGPEALRYNTSGQSNTAVGRQALRNNFNGDENIAIGVAALHNNTTGYRNTAVGEGALLFNIDGFENTAIGEEALELNTSGNNNTAIGRQALFFNTTGNSNTACGNYALEDNTTGSYNVALGIGAGINNVAGDNNIAIGHPGLAADSFTTRIGLSQDRTFIAGIRNTTTGIPDAINVLIDGFGQLGTVSSSRRYKQDIDDMGKASDRLLQLRPVTFRYKESYANGEAPLDYGLIAEEVAEVFPELVVYNEINEPEAVKYRLLSTLLLNELQKQQEELEILSGQLAAIQAQVDELRRQ